MTIKSYHLILCSYLFSLSSCQYFPTEKTAESKKGEAKVRTDSIVKTQSTAAETPAKIEAKKEKAKEPQKEMVAETTYEIGQTVGGGVVFQLNGEQTHGMVCWPGVLADNLDYTTAKNTVLNFHGASTFWRLPSLDELLLISKRRREENMFQFPGNYYWSGTETSENSAWLLHIDVDKKYNGPFTHKYGVIAVHAF